MSDTEFYAALVGLCLLLVVAGEFYVGRGRE
jgi:hypothetical protein